VNCWTKEADNEKGRRKKLEGREEKRNKGKERNSKKRKVERWEENNNFMDNFVNKSAMW